MAKRFIDTDIFKKQFLRDLKAPYKLLWFYIITDCNHSGIWECDFDVAQLRIGNKVNREDAISFFGDKIIELDARSKWFIPSFIEFQYGKLSDQNRAHTAAISLLSKHGLLNSDLTIKHIPKPLTSPLQGAMDMDKEKEQLKEEEKEEEIQQPEEIKNELQSAFDKWVEMRKKMKGGITEHAIDLGKAELKKLSAGNTDTAIQIINQSILNSWKGFFPIKSNENGTKKTGHDIDNALAVANAVLRGEYVDPNFTGN